MVSEITWQWLLGRLYIVERLVIDFPTEFVPRLRPDGASSESSLELIGAASKDEDERPENYDRLLIVAEFAIKAVSNPHARISRVAKRVFLMAARYAAHLESLISELTKLLNDLDFIHKKSLKKQLDKIIADFQLSEQIGRHLHTHNNLVDQDTSPLDTPDVSPLSSPRCTSPVTVISDIQSEAGSHVSKNHPLVPPNTPIKDRRHHIQDETFRASFDQVEEDEESVDEFRKLKPSKSLDDLDCVAVKPRRKLSKSPVIKKVKTRSRSRSRTPQRIGPVLETNLDEVIKLEESRQRLNSLGKLDRHMKVAGVTNVEDDEEVDDDLSLGLEPVIHGNSGSSLVASPPSRLLSHDLETDIDSVEPDLDILLKQKWSSCDNVFDNNAHISGEDQSGYLTKHSISLTPKTKLAKVPNNLSLDLEKVSGYQKSKRSISPCAHVLELERLSSMQNVSETPCQNSLSQSKTILRGSEEPSVNSFQATKSDQKINRHMKKDPSVTKDGVDSDRRIQSSVLLSTERQLSTGYRSSDSFSCMAVTPGSGTDKPVTFQTEVAMATPKHSPSHTLDKGQLVLNAYIL